MREIFSNSIDYKSGQGGSVYITSTGTGAFQGFVACEDTVISSVKDQNGLQILNELGLSGYTVKQGIYIGAPKGRYISEITLSSGSIIGYYTLTGGIVTPGLFDADYQAILDYATTQGYTLPSASQQLLQEQLIIDLKTAGIWNKLDTFAVFATDGDLDFALIDWIRLSQYTAINSPTFTTNEGFTGNGTSSYLDLNYDPTVDGVNYTIDDAAWGQYVFTLNTSNYSFGSSAFGNRFAISAGAQRINCQVNAAGHSAATTGLNGLQRTSSSISKSLLNNGSIGGDVTASPSLLDPQSFYVNRWRTSYANANVSIQFVSSAFNSSQWSSFVSSVDTYIISL